MTPAAELLRSLGYALDAEVLENVARAVDRYDEVSVGHLHEFGHHAEAHALERAFESLPDGDFAEVVATTLRENLSAEVRRLRAQVADLQAARDLACQSPDPECDCPGCSLARERRYKPEQAAR